MSLLSMLSGMGIGLSTGLEMIQLQLSEQLQFNVQEFQMIFTISDLSISFLVKMPDGTGRKYPYNDSTDFCKTVKGILEDNVPKGVSIDYAIAKVSGTEKLIEIYYQQNGEKHKHVINA